MSTRTTPKPPQAIGRYLLCDEIASGGMASVHLGCLVAPEGCLRSVAIKRLHAQFASDPEFVAMFLEEASLAARVRHSHVVPTLDVVVQDGELFLVMEYVEGESLAHLLGALERSSSRMPLAFATFVVAQALLGLHAAHEATSKSGEPLGIVHRDVSPHNILVGSDGIVRVADFGVAKACRRARETTNGRLKGKIAYMAPEQLRQGPIDRRVDVFAASLVLYEALTGRRPFAAEEPAATLTNILTQEVPRPSRFLPEIPAELDRLVLKGLEKDPERRFATAHEMACELQAITRMPSIRELGEWVHSIAGEVLQRRAEQLKAIQKQSGPAVFSARSAVAKTPPVPPWIMLGRVRWATALAAAAPVALLLTLGVSEGGQTSRQPLSAVQTRPKEQPPVGAPETRGLPPLKPQPLLPTADSPGSGTALVKSPGSSRPSFQSPSQTFPNSPGAADPAPAPADLAEGNASESACAPPYTFNPDGSKRFKLECF
jgi:eukaryotic-like serine/threonine-protein kinase